MRDGDLKAIIRKKTINRNRPRNDPKDRISR